MLMSSYQSKVICSLALSIAALILTPRQAQANTQISSSRLSVLYRGINITRWFWAPKSIQYYRSYTSPATFTTLKSAGFTYIRVPLSPEAFQNPDGSLKPDVVSTLVDELTVAEKAGLGVMVQPQRQKWDLAGNEHDRELFEKFWSELAPHLASFDPNLTFPELVNEPNFPSSSQWDDLQAKVLAIVRHALPAFTIILTGNHWSNIQGLTELKVLADQNVVYSFHFYEPSFFVSEWRSITKEDLPVMATLDFPVRDPQQCLRAADRSSNSQTRGAIQWYCKSGWTGDRLKTEIAKAGQWGREHRVPVIDAEFGILNTRGTPARLTYLRAVREAFEAQKMGWGVWAFDDGFGFDVHPDQAPAPKLDPAILSALGLKTP